MTPAGAEEGKTECRDGEGLARGRVRPQDGAPVLFGCHAGLPWKPRSGEGQPGAAC